MLIGRRNACVSRCFPSWVHLDWDNKLPREADTRTLVSLLLLCLLKFIGESRTWKSQDEAVSALAKCQAAVWGHRDVGVSFSEQQWVCPRRLDGKILEIVSRACGKDGLRTQESCYTASCRSLPTLCGVLNICLEGALTAPHPQKIIIKGGRKLWEVMDKSMALIWQWWFHSPSNSSSCTH